MKSIGLLHGSIKKKKGQKGISVGDLDHPSAPRQDPVGPCSSHGSPQQPVLVSRWPYCQGRLALGLN